MVRGVWHVRSLHFSIEQFFTFFWDWATGRLQSLAKPLLARSLGPASDDEHAIKTLGQFIQTQFTASVASLPHSLVSLQFLSPWKTNAIFPFFSRQWPNAFHCKMWLVFQVKKETAGIQKFAFKLPMASGAVNTSNQVSSLTQCCTRGS